MEPISEAAIMDLSDIVGGSGLARFAEIGLVIFFVAFAAIVVRTLRTPRREVEAQARLALDDETGAHASTTAGGGERGQETPRSNDR